MSRGSFLFKQIVDSPYVNFIRNFIYCDFMRFFLLNLRDIY
jgi:hypothetical protein